MEAGTRKTLVLLALVLGLLTCVASGCSLGGGDDEDGGPDAAATYRKELKRFAGKLRDAGKENGRIALAAKHPPELEQLDSQDEAYLDAKAVFERVTPIANELRRLAGLDQKREAKLSTKLYSYASDQYGTTLDIEGKLFSDNADAIINSGDDIDYDKIDLQEAANAKRSARAQVDAWIKYKHRVAAIPLTSELEHSEIDYQLAELEESIAFFKEFKRDPVEFPGPQAHDDYYSDLAESRSEYTTGVPAASVFRNRLVRGMVGEIGQLARARRADAQSPSVGDTYRKLIVDGFVSPLGKDQQRDNKISEQLWLLYRIKQLEDTPASAYQAARETILLQSTDDARNRYQQYVGLLTGLDVIGSLSDGGLPELKSGVKWVREHVDRPVGPIMKPIQAGFQRVLDGIFTGRPVRGTEDYERDFDRINQSGKAYDTLFAAQKKVIPIMRKGAKKLDDPKQLRTALRKAIAATRPHAANAKADGAADDSAAETDG